MEALDSARSRYSLRRTSSPASCEVGVRLEARLHLHLHLSKQKRWAQTLRSVARTGRHRSESWGIDYCSSFRTFCSAEFDCDRAAKPVCSRTLYCVMCEVTVAMSAF